MKLSNLLIVTGLATLGVMLFASPQRQPPRRYRLAGGAGNAASASEDVSADPPAPTDWDPVDEASAESFPASDPPAR